jgi:hypothetical protein
MLCPTTNGRGGAYSAVFLATMLVLGLVSSNLRGPGPDHLRSAFSHGFAGLLAVARNRVPLARIGFQVDGGS